MFSNEESDRLNRLIEEASTMARWEAGEFELHFAPRFVESLVSAALDQCKKMLGDRSVAVNISKDLLPVRADLASASEVLVHLMENAHQYSPCITRRPIKTAGIGKSALAKLDNLRCGRNYRALSGNPADRSIAGLAEAGLGGL